MEVTPLNRRETEVLYKLADPLIVTDTVYKTGWTILMKTKLSILLWIDMVSHSVAIINGTEEWREGVLTIGAFFMSNLFTYPFVRISASETMALNVFLMVVGLYDMKRYLDRETNDRNLRQFVVPFIDGRERVNTRTLQSIYCMKADAVLDETVNFRREIMGTLPLLVTKLYFAYMDSTPCSYMSILRIVVIIFGLYEPVLACVRQEASLVEMLKAGNLYDVGLFHKQGFNPRMVTALTPVLAFGSIALSMVYRVYAIVFYTVLHPLAGLCQLVAALLASDILHCLVRPIYENPPIGCATLSYDVVEIFAKLFLIRNSRGYKMSGRRKLVALWMLLLVLEHFASLFFCQLIFGEDHNLRNDGQYQRACPGWLQFLFEWLSYMAPGQLVAESFADTMRNCLFFNILLLLNISSNCAHLIYLAMAKLNDAQFPTLASYTIWSECLFDRTEKWGGQPNRLQEEWLKKFMVLTLLSRKEFRDNIPTLAARCGRETMIDWDTLARLKLGPLPARPVEPLNPEVPTIALRRFAIPPPELSELIRRAQVEQANSEQLIDFATYIYSINYSDTSFMLRQLVNVFCGTFGRQMNIMTSDRIEITCSLLDIDPVRKSQFKN